MEHGRSWFSANDDNPCRMIIGAWSFYELLKDQRTSSISDKAGRDQRRFLVMNFGPVP